MSKEMEVMQNRKSDLLFYVFNCADTEIFFCLGKRCMQCVGCKAKNCGSCYSCKDMKNFGGPGKKKKACVKRVCTAFLKVYHYR